MKVVIVGGGVMGLMTARELAMAGCEVELLERSLIGQEASWAGGGIVSPLYPWRYTAPVTALASVAQAVYPELARELFNETGIDPELVPCGLLMLDADDARDAEAWAGMNGHCLLRWSAIDLQRQMPGLAAHWRNGLWMPSIANIRNPRLLKALLKSLRQRGVLVHEQLEVTQWRHEGTRVIAALSADGCVHEADAFVICGGAWSRQLLQRGSESSLALRPVRGQMLMYRLEPGALPCIVMAEGRYVIPRRDGLVLCGSTLEESGFDKSTTDKAYESLKASAQRLWPALSNETPVAHWAGLRPVLAPASARLLADQLLKRPVQIDPRPYQIAPTQGY